MVGMAYIWLWLGLGNLQNVPIDRNGVVYLHFSSGVRAALWIVPALAASAVCWSRRWSSYGLALLVIPPTVVILSYGWSLILFYVHGPEAGYGQAYFSAALYGALPGMVTYVAYQPAPPMKSVTVRA